MTLRLDFLYFTSVTGSADSLEVEDGDSLIENMLAIVVESSSKISFYTLDEDSGATADGLNIVAPLTNPGTKRWILTATFNASTAPTAVSSASYTVTQADKIISVSYTATGAVTITIPASVVAIAGWTCDIKDTGGNAAINYITIIPGSGTIDGDPATAIFANYDSMSIYSDGTNLFIK